MFVPKMESTLYQQKAKTMVGPGACDINEVEMFMIDSLLDAVDNNLKDLKGARLAVWFSGSAEPTTWWRSLVQRGQLKATVLEKQYELGKDIEALVWLFQRKANAPFVDVYARLVRDLPFWLPLLLLVTDKNSQDSRNSMWPAWKMPQEIQPQNIVDANGVASDVYANVLESTGLWLRTDLSVVVPWIAEKFDIPEATLWDILCGVTYGAYHSEIDMPPDVQKVFWTLKERIFNYNVQLSTR